MKAFRIAIVGLLIFIALGTLMPMTLMIEPEDPPYLFYTTIWFLAAAFLLYPAGMLSYALRLSASSKPALLIDLIWLIILCAVVYFVPLPAVGSSGEEL